MKNAKFAFETLFIVLFAMFWTGGCVSWISHGVPQYSVHSAKSEIHAFFRTERKLPEIQWEDAESFSNYSIRYFSFSSWRKSVHSKNDKIAGRFYMPGIVKSKDVFLVFPITSGMLPSDKISNILINQGFYVVSIQSGFRPMPAGFMRQAEKIDNLTDAVDRVTSFSKSAMQQHIVDIMRLMDYLEENLDGPLKFHIIGLSLGGTVGSLIAVVDPRVKSLMMIVASANMANIILDRKFFEISAATRIRELFFEKFELNYEEAYKLLASGLAEVESANYANRLNPDRILMVSGALDMLGFVDSAIPYSATYKTWNDFGRPEWVILLTAGHVSSYTAFFLPWFEIQYPHHVVYNLAFESYAEHLILRHFLPKALK